MSLVLENKTHLPLMDNYIILEEIFNYREKRTDSGKINGTL